VTPLLQSHQQPSAFGQQPSRTLGRFESFSAPVPVAIQLPTFASWAAPRPLGISVLTVGLSDRNRGPDPNGVITFHLSER
jgi:hypothetical protein